MNFAAPLSGVFEKSLDSSSENIYSSTTLNLSSRATDRSNYCFLVIVYFLIALHLTTIVKSFFILQLIMMHYYTLYITVNVLRLDHQQYVLQVELCSRASFTCNGLYFYTTRHIIITAEPSFTLCLNGHKPGRKCVLIPFVFLPVRSCGRSNRDSKQRNSADLHSHWLTARLSDWSVDLDISECFDLQRSHLCNSQTIYLPTQCLWLRVYLNCSLFHFCVFWHKPMLYFTCLQKVLVLL